MGKKRKNNETSKHGRKQKQSDADDILLLDQNIQDNSLMSWVLGNKYYIILCLVVGFFVGSGLGTIFFVNDFSQLMNIFTPGGIDYSNNVNIGGGNSGGDAGNSAEQLDHFFPRNLDTFQDMLQYVGIGSWFDNIMPQSVDEYDVNTPHKYINVNGRAIKDVPSHPLTFAILRESVIRIKGGFVHPDLGLLTPAPSGAGRGLGMIRDSYNTCQVRCMPGTTAEKVWVRQNGENDEFPPFWRTPIENLNTKDKMKYILDEQEKSEQKYRQEEILLRIPLKIQMTRNLALNKLVPIIPKDVLARSPLHELDDAALLVLLLAHERGAGLESIFHPYIASLPLNPSCGFSPLLRNEALMTISLMGVEVGMDVNGWPGELSKASDRAHMIAEGLARDYGSYIKLPKGVSASATMQWALCNVASRATAASEKHGALRLIPILDMINHDVNAGGFEELNGAEGNFVHASESDSGTFIVRSTRHGRRKPLRQGQELLVNYNVPNYSPLDWFVSLGFVPPERSGKWTKVEDVLPKSRTYAK
jgi:hypothetical protein